MTKKYIIENLIFGGYYSAPLSFSGILKAFKFNTYAEAEQMISVLSEGTYIIHTIYVVSK